MAGIDQARARVLSSQQNAQLETVAAVRCNSRRAQGQHAQGEMPTALSETVLEHARKSVEVGKSDPWCTTLTSFSSSGSASLLEGRARFAGKRIVPLHHLRHRSDVTIWSSPDV
jgi:hypothetical protein